jgi:hypothetical protein
MTTPEIDTPHEMSSQHSHEAYQTKATIINGVETKTTRTRGRSRKGKSKASSSTAPASAKEETDLARLTKEHRSCINILTQARDNCKEFAPNLAVFTSSFDYLDYENLADTAPLEKGIRDLGRQFSQLAHVLSNPCFPWSKRNYMEEAVKRGKTSEYVLLVNALHGAKLMSKKNQGLSKYWKEAYEVLSNRRKWSGVVEVDGAVAEDEDESDDL